MKPMPLAAARLGFSAIRPEAGNPILLKLVTRGFLLSPSNGKVGIPRSAYLGCHLLKMPLTVRHRLE
jgi:hypothetical protein